MSSEFPSVFVTQHYEHNGVAGTFSIPFTLAYNESENEDDEDALQHYNHHESMGPTPLDTESEHVYGETNESKEETVTIPLTCNACEKRFATKGSLTRHLARFPICAQWIKTDQSDPLLDILELLKKIEEATIGSADPEGFKCRFCASSYSTAGNLKKHFERATTCNKRAVKELLTTMDKMFLPG